MHKIMHNARMANLLIEQVMRFLDGGKPSAAMDKLQRKARVGIMCERYRSGETLDAIGSSYGITRERVRQLISGNGVSSFLGGRRARAAENSRKVWDQKMDARNKRALKWFGVSWSEFVALNDGHTGFWKGGQKSREFLQQRRNAIRRGIAWELTFKDWWNIWENSGKYALRGRYSHSYVMSRIKDTGAYSASNVQIKTARDNIAESYLVTPAHLRHGTIPGKHRQRCTQAYELRKAGKSWAEICESTGIPPKTVGNYIALGKKFTTENI